MKDEGNAEYLANDLFCSIEGCMVRAGGTMKDQLQSTGAALWQNIKQHRWIIGSTIGFLVIIGVGITVWSCW